MRQQQIDHIFTSMLESHDNVSDLNMTVDKPFQVESSGELKPVTLNPPIDQLTPFQTEIVALNLFTATLTESVGAVALGLDTRAELLQAAELLTMA